MHTGLFLIFMVYRSTAMNIAKAKQAKLSKQVERYTAELAVDDYTSTLDANAHFICSQADYQNELAWFAVDLGDIYYISKIEIYGRTNYVHLNHLKDFDVEVMVPPCSRYKKDPWFKFQESIVTWRYSYNDTVATVFVSLKQNEKTKGRYVRVKRRTEGYLVICEIVIEGTLVEETVFQANQADMTFACRYMGTTFEGGIMTTAVAKSGFQCVVLCIQKENCSTAAFNKNKDVCTLYTGRDGTTVQVNGGFRVYFI